MSASELKPFALFCDLGDGERDDLDALLERRDLSVGETLFVEGDESDDAPGQDERDGDCN